MELVWDSAMVTVELAVFYSNLVFWKIWDSDRLIFGFMCIFYVNVTFFKII